jgi:hypothetical protein
VNLDRWPLPYTRLECADCKRFGRLNTDRLIDQYGPDYPMWKLRDELGVAKCEKGTEYCKSSFADAFLVDAIIEQDREKVLKPELIPEAEEWREKLGMRSRGWT